MGGTCLDPILGESFLSGSHTLLLQWRRLSSPPKVWVKDEVFSVYILQGTEGPRESGQFQGLPEAILSPLLPILLNFYRRNGMFPSQRKLLYNRYPAGLYLKNIGKFYSLQSTSFPSDAASEMFMQPGAVWPIFVVKWNIQFDFVETISPLALPYFVTW